MADWIVARVLHLATSLCWFGEGFPIVLNTKEKLGMARMGRILHSSWLMVGMVGGLSAVLWEPRSSESGTQEVWFISVHRETMWLGTEGGVVVFFLSCHTTQPCPLKHPLSWLNPSLPLIKQSTATEREERQRASRLLQMMDRVTPLEELLKGTVMHMWFQRLVNGVGTMAAAILSRHGHTQDFVMELQEQSWALQDCLHPHSQLPLLLAATCRLCHRSSNWGHFWNPQIR